MAFSIILSEYIHDFLGVLIQDDTRREFPRDPFKTEFSLREVSTVTVNSVLRCALAVHFLGLQVEGRMSRRRSQIEMVEAFVATLRKDSLIEMALCKGNYIFHKDYHLRRDSSVRPSTSTFTRCSRRPTPAVDW